MPFDSSKVSRTLINMRKNSNVQDGASITKINGNETSPLKI